MNFARLCWGHKTKLFGLGAAVFGFLQLNFDNVREWIPERYRGLTLMGFGLGAVVLGFFNQQRSSDDEHGS